MTTSTETTSTATTSTTSTTTVWGFPSLFCFSVVRTTGYEPKLLQSQLDMRASIFNCDEFTVFSNGGTIDLGGWKTAEIPAPEVGMGNLNAPGTTTNSWLNTLIFMEAWKLVSYDG